MTVSSLADWLQCPHCTSPLSADRPLTLRCALGHSFDVNKRGFINLLASGNRMTGDSPAMLDARSAFLDAGHFEPVRDALVHTSGLQNQPQNSDQSSSAPLRIIDAGCGTGYYLEGFLSQQPSGLLNALAMDISPHAVARAVRNSQLSQRGENTTDGLVADIWQPLPIRDASADFLFAVFAPRNFAEFHRVVVPHGRLSIVVPTSRHIWQLRESGLALEIPAGKAQQLETASSQYFELVSSTRVEYEVELSPDEASQLVAMGPSAHHVEQLQALSSPQGSLTVTVSVDVLSFRAIPR